MEPSHRQLRRRRVDDRASAAVSDAPTPLMRPTGTHIQRFEHAPLSGADLGYFFSFFLIKKEKVSPPTVESHAPPDPARPPATLPRRTVRKTGIPSALVPFRTQNAHGAENGVFHRSVVMQDLRNSIFCIWPKGQHPQFSKGQRHPRSRTMSFMLITEITTSRFRIRRKCALFTVRR